MHGITINNDFEWLSMNCITNTHRMEILIGGVSEQ